LCNLRPLSSGAITYPPFLDALLYYLRENYYDLDIVVIESDATESRPDIIIKWFNLINFKRMEYTVACLD